MENNQKKIIKDLGMLFENENSTKKRHYYLTECMSCEKEYKIRDDAYKKKDILICRKCDCIDKATRHGDRHTRLYSIFRGMKDRCYNKNSTSYQFYGAKGVTICKEWLNDYLAFKEWALSNGYEEHLTIDKDRLCILSNIEPKIYRPDTCEWIEEKEQHSRKSIRVTNSSDYIGVSWCNNKNEYRARITIDKKEILVCYSKDKKECAINRDLYIVENNLPHTKNFN